MIEHLTLVIAGACLWAGGEWIRREDRRLGGGLQWFGAVIFGLGVGPALMGALGL